MRAARLAILGSFIGLLAGCGRTPATGPGLTSTCGDCPANTVCVDGSCRPVTGMCANGCPAGSVYVGDVCVATGCGAGCPPNSICQNNACVPVGACENC